MPGARRDLWLGIGILLLAALGLLLLIPLGIVVPDDIETRALSPDFWPMIVMVVLALAGVAVALQGLGRPGARAEPAAAGDEMHPPAIGNLRVAAVIAGLLLVYLLIPTVGMVVAGMVSLGLLAWFAGERRWKALVPISIALPVGLYLFFVHVANVPLPIGLFEAWR